MLFRSVREILSPAHSFQIILIMPAAFTEISQVAVWKIGNVLLHVLLSQRDEEGTNSITDATRSAMQHHPHAVRLIEADLNKVVDRSQSTQMQVVGGCKQLRIAIRQVLKPRSQLGRVRVGVTRGGGAGAMKSPV